MADEKIYLTEEGYKEKEDRLNELRNVFRPAVVERIKFAKEQGDLSENAEYSAAREEQAKIEGEKQRTKNDLFFLSLAIAIKEDIATVESAKKVLHNAFAELSFENLTDVKFVGDGTYLKFTDKYIEIRPSGTDAKTKAYGAGVKSSNK